MKRLLIIFGLLALLVTPALAQDDSPSGFDTLLAAIDAAGLTETLDGDGPFTIFAPTNAAFGDALAALDLTAEELLADTDLLTSVLTYHVVDGAVMAADVVALVEAAEDGVAEVETLNGATFTVELVDGTPVINGSASVFLPDVSASNGVIHGIDAVLLPPMETDDSMADEDMTDDATETESMADEDMTDDATETESMTDEATEEEVLPEDEEMSEVDPADEADALPSIVEIAVDNEDFSTLVAALEAADLVETLDGDAPFTVFAPTNDAFEAALAELDLTAEELLADTDTLTDILTYHVVEGATDAATLMAAAEAADGDISEIATVNGDILLVSVDDDGNLLLNGEMTVATADIEANNGFIHVIDSVLLPPDPQ